MSNGRQDSRQKPTDAATLRKLAEEQARSMEPISPSAQTPEALEQMLHELRVHQIELEMQNEELRRAQAEIEAGRARYFDLYDLAPVGYCTLSEKGLILEANLTVATLLGVARSALIKQPLSRFILKEDQDIFFLHRKQLFETGEPQDCDLRLLKADDTPFWAHLTGTVAQGENGGPVCRVVISDISERKRAEVAVRKSEQELRLTLDATTDGIWQWHFKTSSLFFSPRYYTMLGYAPDEFLATYENWKALIHPDDLDAALSVAEEFLKDYPDKYENEFRMKTKSGDYRWIYATGRIIEKDKNGLAVRMIGSHRDINDRKLAEDQIQQQLAEKEILLKEVHHRVKNNIANIEGLLSIQAHSTNTPEVKSALQDTISRVQSIRVLYDRLLLSKEYRDVPMKYYTESLIDSIVNIFISDKNITIDKKISEFIIDFKKATSIGIIINELLTNVFKYAFKDMDSGTVSISIDIYGKIATLIIKDNGIGIDESIERKSSYGFGLTIIKLLVEQLKGTYSIKNENGTKSIIQFEI